MFHVWMLDSEDDRALQKERERVRDMLRTLRTDPQQEDYKTAGIRDVGGAETKS